MQRITKSQLQTIVDGLNRQTHSPMTPYADGQWHIGCYCLSYAYGGVALHRVHNEAGGMQDVLERGHVSKRDLYNLLRAYSAGLQAAA